MTSPEVAMHLLGEHLLEEAWLLASFATTRVLSVAHHRGN